MTKIAASLSTPPLVIGATGGSGTRVIARIAMRSGYYIGTNRNEPDDALEFLPFHDTWINRFVKASRSEAPLSPDEASRMDSDFDATLERHLGEMLPAVRDTGARWGWKAPRSIYLLPYFHQHFPAMKFIHVVRDGRDMAFSKNQNQLNKNGRVILNLRERWLLPRPLQALLLWDRVNREAADFAEAQMPGRYLRVRFEDLCREPVSTTERILHFIRSDLDPRETAEAEIKPPSSLGRWNEQPAALIARMNEAGAASLSRLGYLDNGLPAQTRVE